jgi:hypothetical protein
MANADRRAASSTRPACREYRTDRGPCKRDYNGRREQTPLPHPPLRLRDHRVYREVEARKLFHI